MKTLRSKDGKIVVTPSKIVCLGRNYRKHAEELGNVVPEKPIIFLKPNSSLITEGEKIILPSQSRNVHHEVELGVVMRRGKDIPQGNAFDYVLGIASFSTSLPVIYRMKRKKGTPHGHSPRDSTPLPPSPSSSTGRE